MSESERSKPIEPDELDATQSQEVQEPSDDARNIAAESRISIVSQEFSGPLPHPAILQQYEEIQPGLADRILRMAEQQGQHRQQLEKKALDAEIKDAQEERSLTRRGQWFGLAIGMTALVCATVTTIFGHPWTGGFIGVGGVAGLVMAFLIGHRRQASNRGSH